jgi:hypothetical protein
MERMRGHGIELSHGRRALMPGDGLPSGPRHSGKLVMPQAIQALSDIKRRYRYVLAATVRKVPEVNYQLLPYRALLTLVILFWDQPGVSVTDI